MIIYSVLALFAAWILILTYLLYRTRRHYNKLTSLTGAATLDRVLDQLLEHDQQFTKDISKAQEVIREIGNKSKSYFQKIGFVRFNPFKRVSGSQSFILALLDGEDNGILLNFLYTREGIRVYAKRLKRGKSTEYELSDEEKEAIEKSK